MKLSVIIPYTKGDYLRERGLSRLMWCLQDQLWDNSEPVKYELIVSEVVFDNEHPFPFVVDKHIVIRQEEGLYSKSVSMNEGVRNASYENILMLDADIRFDTDYIQKIIEHAPGKEFFMGYSAVRLERGIDNFHRRVMTIKEIMAVAMSFFITKDLYWRAGGGNEKYIGYGGEDNDFWTRIKHIIKFEHPAPCMDYEIDHTYHHWHREGSKYPLNPRRVSDYLETKKDVQKEIDRLCQANKKKIGL